MLEIALPRLFQKIVVLFCIEIFGIFGHTVVGNMFCQFGYKFCKIFFLDCVCFADVFCRFIRLFLSARK